MTKALAAALLAGPAILLAACGTEPAAVATRSEDTTAATYEVERIDEPFAIPGDEEPLRPASADEEPIADVAKAVSDSRSLPEDLEEAEPRILLGMYSPRSTEAGADERRLEPRLVYVLLFDVVSRPLGGPPPLPGETVRPIEPAPATVVTIYDASTGERLNASTVGCGVTHTCSAAG